MNPERWKRVRDVFERALYRPPDRVDEFLRAECGDDGALYTEVRHMLAANEETGPLDYAVVAPAAGSAPSSRARTGAASGPVFQPGDTLAGRYRVVRYLSRGGMGEVYEAEHLELLGERVALKTLLPDIACDAGMIARFKREIQLSRKITHPNVCRVFDLERHPPDGPPSEATYFFTMAFLEGETLSARLERGGRMTLAEALPLLDQMADALDAAHQAGVIHRDFKPSNVILVKDSGGPPRAVVTDFGLARRAVGADERTVTQSGQLMGTLDYMAPELLAGAQSSVQSDVYALGMTAYKLLTGALPFRSTTPLGAAILRSKEPVPSPRIYVPELDPQCERALVQSLNADPNRRFHTARALVQAMRGVTSSVTVKLPVMTKRRWIGYTAAVVLAAGALVGWRSWDHMRHRPSPEALVLYRTGLDDIHAGAYFAATKALGQAVKAAPNFVLAHARLAEAWMELEQPDRASHEMLVTRRLETGGLSEIDRLQLEAVDLTITRDYAAAAAKYERLRTLAGGDATGLDLDLGRAYEQASNMAKAIEAYRRTAEGPSQSAAAWLRLGVLYAQGSAAAKSEEAFGNAERQYQNTSNLEGITEVELQRGLAANRQLRLPDGAAHLQRAFDTARLAGNVQQEIRSKMQLGTNATLAGDTDKAEQYSREALEMAESNQMQSQAARGMLGIGAAYLRRRDFANAARNYQSALALARSSGVQRLVAVSLLSLASLHDQVADSAAAEREALEAFNYYHANNVVKEELQCLVLAGRAQRKRGDFVGAVASFQQLLEIAQKANDRPQIVLGHEAMGNLYEAQERYPEALAEFQKNLEPPVDTEHLAWAQWETASMLWRLGNYAEARRLNAEASETAKKFPALRAAMAIDNAQMDLSQEKFAAAVAAARGPAASAPGADVPMWKAVLGLALAGTGQRGEGVAACDQAVAASQAISEEHRLVTAELALLRARVETGDAAGARVVFGELSGHFANYPESRWRALAWIGRVDAAYKDQAIQAVEDLKHRWGDAPFAGYRQRPDISRLLRPLRPQFYANP